MSDAKQMSGAEAIEMVLAEGSCGDFVDVVDAVYKRFRIEVTAAQVEDVYHELLKEKSQVRAGSRVDIQMSGQIPNDAQAMAGSASDELGSASELSDEVVLALQFVKSVGSFPKAKQALAELEQILVNG